MVHRSTITLTTQFSPATERRKPRRWHEPADIAQGRLYRCDMACGDVRPQWAPGVRRMIRSGFANEPTTC
jgi:hypothetical protein